MTFQFRPARRSYTPVMAGLAGPSKSGKTYSALRLARGLAEGKEIVMINCEGARGEMYADFFDYTTVDMEPPFSPERFDEAVRAGLRRKPGVMIIDSMSHMHDGPGGMLEYHEAEVDRITKGSTDFSKRQRATWSAWIKPKQAESAFVYTLLGSRCHFVLCFRAKEKLKIVAGKDPIPLGWQPIASDKIAFETAFTLLLPPHANGVPDLSAGASELRTPFDAMIPPGKQIDEELGTKLLAWAAGAAAAEGTPANGDDGEGASSVTPEPSSPLATEEQRMSIVETARMLNVSGVDAKRVLREVAGVDATADLPSDKVGAVLEALASLALPGSVLT